MLGAGCPRVTHPFAARAPSRRTGLARLACVKHAASVRPEPGSNSPWMSYDYSWINPAVSTWKVLLLKTATTLIAGPYELTILFCSMYQRKSEGRIVRFDNLPTGLIYGTNFRHAVEFSRSRCTPSSSSRTPSGQPMKHYPVSSARSRIRFRLLIGTARIPHLVAGWALGGRAHEHPRCRAWGVFERHAAEQRQL